MSTLQQLKRFILTHFSPQSISLRVKIFVLIVTSSVAMLFISSIIADKFLYKSYLALENKYMLEELGRINEVNDSILSSMLSFANEWSTWEDFSRTIQDHTYVPLDKRLGPESMLSLDLNAFLLLDTSGNIVVRKSWPTSRCDTNEVNLDFVRDYSQLKHNAADFKMVKGLCYQQGHLFYVVSVPVLPAPETPPAVGSIVLVKCLSEATIAPPYILDSVFSLRLMDVQNLSQAEHNIYEQLLASPSVMKVVSKDVVAGYLLLRDINDQPISIVEILRTRDVMKAGLSSIRYFIMYNIFLMIPITLILLFILELMFFKRLNHIKKLIVDISTTSDMSLRVPVIGSDELGYLSHRINHMLTVLENTQTELAARNKLEGIVEIGGTICHELNQPLTALTGYVDLLLMKIPPDQVAIIERVEKIHREAQRMGELTRKLNNVLRKKEFIQKEYLDNVNILDIHQEE